ncbi:MAG: nucleoside deaminase [archaeon]
MQAAELNQTLMTRALKEAERGVRRKKGGPFGAAIAKKGGKLVSTGVNMVPFSNDPTAHAEIVAIRRACRKLGTFSLAGCTLYSTCEPCPMCLAAINWARIDKVYYGATRRDAAKIGFDDEFFYDVLRGIKTGVPKKMLLRERALPIMREWFLKKDKVEY